MSAILTEALAALYVYGPKCDACKEHGRTRRGEDWIGCGHEVCDRADCGDMIACDACGQSSPVPRDGEPMRCGECECDCADVRRVPRSTAWRDLPHAATLRAANAAHEALS